MKQIPNITQLPVGQILRVFFHLRMNILRVLLPAYLAIAIGSAQYEEEFKITTGKKIRRGGAPWNYRYHQLNSHHNPYASPNYGVNPAYLPVVYGVRPAVFQLPPNAQTYTGYPFLQGPQQFHPQQQAYDSNQNYASVPIGPSNTNNGVYGIDRTGGKHVGGFLSPAFVDAINKAQNMWTVSYSNFYQRNFEILLSTCEDLIITYKIYKLGKYFQNQ